MDSVVSRAIKHFGLVLSFFIICSYRYTNSGYEVYVVAIGFVVLSMIINWLIEWLAFWAYPSTKDNTCGEIIYASLFGINILVSITFFYKIVTKFDVVEAVLSHWHYQTTINFLFTNKDLFYFAISISILQIIYKNNDYIGKVNSERFSNQLNKKQNP